MVCRREVDVRLVVVLPLYICFMVLFNCLLLEEGILISCMYAAYLKKKKKKILSAIKT